MDKKELSSIKYWQHAEMFKTKYIKTLPKIEATGFTQTELCIYQSTQTTSKTFKCLTFTLNQVHLQQFQKAVGKIQIKSEV